ncbi:MAG: hypothetical protein LC641_09230 [Spirochaeta sp.]|nr:hypothetical protein [Spirochaeta sp.]
MPDSDVVTNYLVLGNNRIIPGDDGAVAWLWDSDGTVLTADNIRSQLAQEQQQFDDGEIAETTTMWTRTSTTSGTTLVLT